MQTGKHIEKSRYLHCFGLHLTSLQSSNSNGSQMLITSESSLRHVLLNQTLVDIYTPMHSITPHCFSELRLILYETYFLCYSFPVQNVPKSYFV